MDDSKQSAEDLDWAVGINRVTLKIVGLWPDDTLTRRQRFIADARAIIIFFLMICTSIVPGYFAVIRVWGDMMSMIDNLQIGLPFTVTSLKYIIIWFRKDELVPIINMIVNDWMRKKTAQEREAMIRQARYARATILFGAFLMVVVVVILIIPPCFGYTLRYLTNLTDPGRPLLVQTYYFKDVSETPHYEILFVAQAISIIMAAISYTGIDTFMGLVVFHICAQLEILQTRLLNLNSFKDFNTGLSFNVEDHLRLIRSVDIIDNTFNLLFLVLLVFFASLFCLQGFLIVSMIDGTSDVSFFRICWLISILINTFVHMCLYCVVGEMLIGKAEGVYFAAYNYEWYMLKPSEARSLLMIMIRAEKPLYVTAGKICPLTLSMFCSLIKTSAGYVSVLLANR